MSEKSSPSATRRPRRPPTKTLALAAAAGMALGLPLVGTAGAAAAVKPGPVSIAGTAPSWAVASHAVGAASSGQMLNLSVRLRVDTAGARAYAAAVSKPGSRVQGRFLSPRAWTARFGASPAEAAKVAAFMRAQGFTHVAVNASRTAVAARGSIGLAQRAFGVKVERYTVAGHTLRGPDRNVRVPANIAHAVTAVVGLSEARATPDSVRIDQPRGTRRAPTGSAAAPTLIIPCSSYYGQYEVSGIPAAFGVTTLPTTVCDGYVPKQIESAYGLTSTLASGTTGRGVKVAILDAYELPTMKQDLARYSKSYGLPAMKPGQYTENVPAAYGLQDQCGGIDGWNGEEALDVESVHTTAPGASIVYVAGADCGSGLSDAFDRLLAGNGSAPLATIASNSYGYVGEDLPAADLQAATVQFLQAAAEGISVLFSSGDNGDTAAYNDGIAEPDFYAVSPWVTAVGGTSVGISSSGRRIFQTGWETSHNYAVDAGDGTLAWELPLPGEFYAGAGGGTSALFAEPGYQKGVVPDALAYARGNGRPGRVVPDISAIGDPYTGFRYGYSSLDPTTGTRTYVEGGIGGTSVSSPMTAGMVALAQQWNKRPLGFLNPALYALHTTSAVTDVRPPNPDAFPSQQAVLYDSALNGSELVGLDKGSTLLTTRGYDDVTGLGSPNGIYFLTNLARVLK